ncbi:hypothetical protein JKY72_05255 [Candidatus Gracilibacteria bacterium]|nr:hypothetical protein [Candidatus Gracilibacteria bacterium]
MFKIFLGIVAVKVLLSFFVQGIIIAPDEGCVIKSAQYLANNFEYKHCSELTNLNAGDAPFFPVVLYSVFYFLFSPVLAFKASLIFNSVLAASLVYPFFKIVEFFIKDERKSLYLAIALTFIPSIFLFEKALMTEIVFAATNVWALHFYIQSFVGNKVRNKVAAFLLAFLGIFMRPYGFITIVALQMNEFFGAGKRRRLLKLGALVLLTLFVGYFLKDKIAHQLSGLHVFSILIGFWATVVRVAQSLLTGLNTLTLSTLMLPFAVLIFTRGKEVKLIRVFLFTFIFLYIAILLPRLFIDSSYPNITYSSLSERFAVPETLFGLGRGKIIFKNLFRYFNVSTILITLFGVISILKYERKALGKSFVGLVLALVAGLFFVNFGENVYHQVISHSYLIVDSLQFIFYVLIVVALVATGFLMKRKGDVSLKIMFVTLMIVSLLSFEYNVIRSFYRAPANNEIVELLRENEGDVLFLMRVGDMKDPVYWAANTTLANQIDTFFYEGEEANIFRIISIASEKYESVDVDLDQYEFVVSRLELEREKLLESAGYSVYGL